MLPQEAHSFVDETASRFCRLYGTDDSIMLMLFGALRGIDEIRSDRRTCRGWVTIGFDYISDAVVSSFPIEQMGKMSYSGLVQERAGA